MKNQKILVIIIIILLTSIIVLLWINIYSGKNTDIHSIMMWMWNNKWNIDDEMMKEHCKMMPEMQWCEKYIDNDNKPSNDVLIYWNRQEWKNIYDENNWFTNEIVNLKDWDSYTMEITKVKKKIWDKYIDMLAYNSMIPGPIIKAKVWSKVKITLVNKVSDLETTLHSHWLRLSDMFDWVTKDMMWKQDPIKTWDSFTYEISFPDVWVFWYHPHMREDVQQELGLYWNYIVEPNDENYYSKVNREWPIILDDIALDWDKLKPFYKDYTDHVLMWRYGNTSFVNWNTDYKLEMKKWEVVRAYLTDVANTRVFNFKIPWVKMKLVWSDIWKYEKETFVDSIIISPWERYIVDLYAPNFGVFDIQNATPTKNYSIWKVIVSDESIDKSYSNDFNKLDINSDTIKDIEKYKKYFYKKVDKNLSLELWHSWMKWWMWNMMWWMMSWDSHDWIEWEDNMEAMNENSNSKMLEWKIIDVETKNENMWINWQFKKWDVVKIHIENKKDGMHPMQHPFHMHGQRFLVLSRDWIKQENLVWKDTVLVKTWEIVELLVDMNNPWEWMAHCHISEHLFSGMMIHFGVKE